jgi:hypothetical protein
MKFRIAYIIYLLLFILLIFVSIDSYKKIKAINLRNKNQIEIKNIPNYSLSKYPVKSTTKFALSFGRVLLTALPAVPPPVVLMDLFEVTTSL